MKSTMVFTFELFAFLQLTLRNAQLLEVVRLELFNRILKERAGCLDTMEVVSREFENCNPATFEVLLVTNILIRRDEEIEFALCTSKQVAVLNSAPTFALN